MVGRPVVGSSGAAGCVGLVGFGVVNDVPFDKGVVMESSSSESDGGVKQPHAKQAKLDDLDNDADARPTS